MANERLNALMEDTDEDQEPDPNVVPIPDRVSKDHFTATLRAGQHIQVGHDPNDEDSFIHGPCLSDCRLKHPNGRHLRGPVRVPLTPSLAIAHMAKWEQPNEVKQWLARNHPAAVDGKPHLAPRTSKRLSPAETMDRNVNRAREINESRGIAPRAQRGGGISEADVVDVVQRELKPIHRTLEQIVTTLGQRPVGVPAHTGRAPVRSAAPPRSRVSKKRRGGRRRVVPEPAATGATE